MNRVLIPTSIQCQPCKHCGARPVIVVAEKNEYIVKCPDDDAHYQTVPGLIDIEDWNIHNTILPVIEYSEVTPIAC